jgi:hypothetical protein
MLAGSLCNETAEETLSLDDYLSLRLTFSIAGV